MGKNAGDHPFPSMRSIEFCLREGQKGKKVVRLKAEILLFSGAEEKNWSCCEAGVPFEVVPGITSSIAVPAYAGIPVTHRDFAPRCTSSPGTPAGAELSIDYEALVRLKGTLIFMMSVSTIGQIASGLMEAGMEETMPVQSLKTELMPDRGSLSRCSYRRNGKEKSGKIAGGYRRGQGVRSVRPVRLVFRKTAERKTDRGNSSLPARRPDWKQAAGSGRGNPSLSVYPNGFYPADFAGF